MIVGVAKETFPGERRVALIPANVPQLTKSGMQVVVEAGAGTAAGFLDGQYAEKGAQVVGSRDEVFRQADVLVQVRSLGANRNAGRADLPRLRAGQVVIGMCDPLVEAEAAREMAARGVTLFGLELIPRITRAQSMDVLSSMATIAGYKAVLLAADRLPRMFPLLMTAAGTITAARVFVAGAGVAGLQAIATARRLGAIVQGYDVRAAVKDQIQSLGAKFVELPVETAGAEGAGGYARELSEDAKRRQRELLADVVADCDVCITTAAVPGGKSPVLITAEAVAKMRPGSVIVDLAAERGGNCELTRPDETVVENNVTILGPTNLPAEVPYHASQMFSKNITTLLLHLAPRGTVQFDFNDDITRDTLVALGGSVVHSRLREKLALEPRVLDTSDLDTLARAPAVTMPTPATPTPVATVPTATVPESAPSLAATGEDLPSAGHSHDDQDDLHTGHSQPSDPGATDVWKTASDEGGPAIGPVTSSQPFSEPLPHSLQPDDDQPKQ